MSVRGCLLLSTLLLLALVRPAAADRIDTLSRALMQDPSYKVRVQAALVLGKLGDRRAEPALIQALRDENATVRGVAATALGRLGDSNAGNALLQATHDSSPFVREQALHALSLLGTGSSLVLPGPRAGARFYIAIGFGGSGRAGGAEYARVVREALVRELAKVPNITLSVRGGGAPSESALSRQHLEGYYVDGSIQRLSTSGLGASAQIDCDLKAFVATYPGKSIRMMTTEGASLQTGSGPGESESGKRDCLEAAVGAVREDVQKFLQTVQ